MGTNTPMTSAQRKLAWGVGRVKALQGEVEDYLGRQTYVFDAEHEVRSSTEVHFRCFATEVEPPPDHWSLVAGDAIQNIRAALDHCVWAAWRSVTTNTGDGRHTQFVIAEDTKGWKDQQGRLAGVPGTVQALVERWQPYNRLPQRPKDDTLAILARLSNADKHRALNVVAVAVGLEMVGVPDGVKLKQWETAGGKRLAKGRAEVARFVATSDTPFDPTRVAPDFKCAVNIEGLSLAMLREFVHDVFEVVVEAETGSMPEPFAPYPL